MKRPTRQTVSRYFYGYGIAALAMFVAGFLSGAILTVAGYDVVSLLGSVRRGWALGAAS